MSCGVGRRHGSDPVLLWPWHRMAAVAPIEPLAWEHPYATGAALKSKKKRRRNVDVLMWCGRLRIQHCHCSGSGHCSGSIPGPRNFLLPWAQPKTKQRCCRRLILYLKHKATRHSIFVYFICFLFVCFVFSRATPVAYGGSQIGATAAGLHHSHSNTRSEPLTATLILNPLSEARDRTCNLIVPSWIC